MLGTKWGLSARYAYHSSENPFPFSYVLVLCSSVSNERSRSVSCSTFPHVLDSVPLFRLRSSVTLRFRFFDKPNKARGISSLAMPSTRAGVPLSDEPHPTNVKNPRGRPKGRKDSGPRRPYKKRKAEEIDADDADPLVSTKTSAKRVALHNASVAPAVETPKRARGRPRKVEKEESSSSESGESEDVVRILVNKGKQKEQIAQNASGSEPSESEPELLAGPSIQLDESADRAESEDEKTRRL